MKHAFSSKIIDRLKDVLGEPEVPVVLHEPLFTGNEKIYLNACIDTGYVSSVGSYVDLFEKKLAQQAGTAHAVVTVNGTAALHIALILADVQPDDEVLVPALTFIATANAVSYCGAVPHFIESCVEDFGVDVQKLDHYLEKISVIQDGNCINKATGRKIAAMVPMHVFGHPVEWDSLAAIAAKYNILIIEDAAESVGSTYKGRAAGSLGRMAALSFNGNKIITTGGGGAVLTNDADLARRAKYITTTAKQPHKWAFFHDEVGYNYRLPNINAALGCAQIENLNGYVAAKRALTEKYIEHFSDFAHGYIFREKPEIRSNYWLNSLVLEKGIDRDSVLQDLHDHNFLCRPVWTCLHRLPMYADCPKMDLSVAEDLEARIINIPSSVKHGLKYHRLNS